MATAIGAMHTPLLRVSHRERPPLWLAQRPGEVLFAVFDGSDAFLGLVGWRHVVRHPRRIFADQLPRASLEPVSPEATLEDCLASMRRQRVTALPVFDDGTLRGAVSHASVLESATKIGTPLDVEPLFDEVQRLEALNLELAGRLHDIRNELQVAVSTLTLSSSGESLERSEVGGALWRAVELCRQVPIDAPTMRREPATFGLGTVLEQLLPTLRATLAGRGTITILGSAELRVRIDRLDLERALINLVKNAAEAAPDPVSITITIADAGSPVRAANETWLAAGRHVRVTVRDDGPGMDAATLRQVSAGAAVDGRHGLGLVTARRLLRRNGGTLRFVSDVGAGTTIELLVPAADV